MHPSSLPDLVSYPGIHPARQRWYVMKVVCRRMELIDRRKHLYSDNSVCFYLFFSHNCIILCLWTTGCKSPSNFARKRIQKGVECWGIEWSAGFLAVIIVWWQCIRRQYDSVASRILCMEGIYITKMQAGKLSNERNLNFRLLRWLRRNEWIRTVQSRLMRLCMCKTRVDSE